MRISEENLDEYFRQIKDLTIELVAGVCPIWQCGGELEYIEDRINWQEPDIRCKSCGAFWKLVKRP